MVMRHRTTITIILLIAIIISFLSGGYAFSESGISSYIAETTGTIWNKRHDIADFAKNACDTVTNTVIATLKAMGYEGGAI